MRLSKKKFWEVEWEGKSNPANNSSHKNITNILKKILGNTISDYFRSYDDYLLWDVIYKRYISQKKGLKVLEIGSAPGSHLVKLKKTFGLNPFGVEYSENGAEANRKLFIQNNINPNNVIQADFFSQEFQNQYSGSFDIVISRGFIEHFTDVKHVVEKHIDLLKDSGRLIITVPNFKGLLYYAWLRLFRKEKMEVHNFDIMEKRKFIKIFDGDRINKLYCNYFGTFSFHMFITDSKSLLRPFVLSGYYLQKILNIVFRVFLRSKGMESRFFSPHLIFIGQKNREKDQVFN